MDILNKLEKIDNKIKSKKEEESSVPLSLVAGHYPGGYEKMDDILLSSYYELACDEYEESYKALKEIRSELEKRKNLKDVENIK